MKNILDSKPPEEVKLRERKVIDLIDKGDIKGKKVLNIGCGWGWFEIQASKLGVDEIIGIEPIEKDLTTALKYAKRENVDFKVGSAIEIPFEENSFDTVTSWEVLEHIPKKTENKMFSEIHRVLKNEGVFYMSTPQATFVSKLLDPAWWLIGHRHYKLKQLEEFGIDNGLELTEYHFFADIWELLYTINEYVAKWVFRRGPFLIDFFEKKVEEEIKKNTGRSSIWCKFKKV